VSELPKRFKVSCLCVFNKIDCLAPNDDLMRVQRVTFGGGFELALVCILLNCRRQDGRFCFPNGV